MGRSGSLNPVQTARWALIPVQRRHGLCPKVASCISSKLNKSVIWTIPQTILNYFGIPSRILGKMVRLQPSEVVFCGNGGNLPVVT
jgi:hypothetical protein